MPCGRQVIRSAIMHSPMHDVLAYFLLFIFGDTADILRCIFNVLAVVRSEGESSGLRRKGSPFVKQFTPFFGADLSHRCNFRASAHFPAGVSTRGMIFCRAPVRVRISIRISPRTPTILSSPMVAARVRELVESAISPAYPRETRVMSESTEEVSTPPSTTWNQDYFTIAAGLLLGLAVIVMSLDTLRRIRAEQSTPETSHE